MWQKRSYLLVNLHLRFYIVSVRSIVSKSGNAVCWRFPIYTKFEMSNFLHLRILLRPNGAELICEKMIECDVGKWLLLSTANDLLEKVLVWCPHLTEDNCSTKVKKLKIWWQRFWIYKNVEISNFLHLLNLFTANGANLIFGWNENEQSKKMLDQWRLNRRKISLFFDS